MIQELSLSSFGDRILIVTPHPDDETIATGGFIQRSLQSGKQVQLVVMTNGDGFRKAACQLYSTRNPGPEDYKKLGELRQTELLKAVSHLGLSPDKVHFLGFPDTGLSNLWEESWENNTYTSRTGSSQCPYSLACQPKVPYAGLQLIQLLGKLIQKFGPSDVIYPAREDQHKDHSSTQNFTRLAISQNQLSTHEWSYLVHYSNWPHPHSYRPDSHLTVPKSLFSPSKWYSLELKPSEINVKKNALSEHKSQIFVMKGYLQSFIRKNELFQKI